MDMFSDLYKSDWKLHFSPRHVSHDLHLNPYVPFNVYTKWLRSPEIPQQYAHSRTAVRNSRTEMAMHALIIWYLRAKT